MAKNSIEAVREAESKAEEITRAAAQESAVIVDEAQNKAILMENEAEDAARGKAADNIAAAHKESQKALEDSMEALNGEMQALCNNARKHQSDAIKMILASLVKQ